MIGFPHLEISVFLCIGIKDLSGVLTKYFPVKKGQNCYMFAFSPLKCPDGLHCIVEKRDSAKADFSENTLEEECLAVEHRSCCAGLQ